MSPPVQKNGLTARTYANMAALVSATVAVVSCVGGAVILPVFRADARQIAVETAADAIKAHASNPHPGGLTRREVEQLFQRLERIEAEVRKKD